MVDSRLVVEVSARDNLTNEFKHIESGVIRFVGAVSSAFTLLSGITFPILEATEFQKELLNAGKTTEYNTEELSKLREELRAISEQTNITAVDLAKIATLGGQLGIGSDGRVSALVEFVEAIGTAVTALDLSAEQVVSSVGKLINIFNIPPSQFRNAISALNEVSNVSNATADQLFDVVRRIGNLGGSVTLPEAASLSATMIDLGLTSETAGTTITKIFADFKADAAEFAAITRGETIKSTQDWVNLVSTKGIPALTLYLDALNAMPVAEASAVKSRLTGEGRLFEAVTKLQEQRRRQKEVEELAAEAAREYSQAVKDANLTSENSQAIKGLELRAKHLEEAAKQANALTRLTTAADAAFLLGDSAEKEQQAVLGGLTAQWVVFVNNIKSLTGEIGNTFIPSLTRSLISMSEAMRDAVNSDSVRRAAEDILSAFRLVKETVEDLRESFSSLGSSGFDFGAALRLGSLITAVTVLKGLGTLVSFLASKAATAIPILGTLGRTLFGVGQAASSASAAVTDSGNSLSASGGLFTRTTAAIREMTTEYSRLLSEKQRSDLQLTRAADKVAQFRSRLQDIFAVKGTSAKGLNTLQDTLNRIRVQEESIEKARAAGEKSRLGGLTKSLRELERHRDAIVSAQTQLDAYQKKLSSLGGLNNRLQEQLSQFPLITSLDKAIDSALEAGRRIGSGIASGINRAIGSIQSQGFVNALSSGLSAFQRRASLSAKRAGDALQSAFSKATQAARSFFSSAARGFSSFQSQAKSSAAQGGDLGGTRLLSAAQTAAQIAQVGLVRSLSAAVGGLILRVTNLGEAWTAAGTKATKALVGTAAAISLVQKAISGIGSLITKAFRIFFIAQMGKELLKMTGLWDRLTSKIKDFLDAIGIETPSWLLSEEDARELARAVDRIRTSYQNTYDDAARFNGQMKGAVLAAENLSLVLKSLTFDPRAPRASSDSVIEYLDAIDTADARRKEILSQIEILEKIVTKEKEKQKRLGTDTSPAALRASESLGAEPNPLPQLEQEIKLLQARLEAIGDTDKARRNTAIAAFSEVQAQKLFNRSAENGLSLIERLLVFRRAELATAKQLAEEEKRAKPDAGNLSSGTVAAALSEGRRLIGVTADLREAQKAYSDGVQEVRAEISKALPFNRLGERLVDSILSKKDLDLLQSRYEDLADFVSEGRISPKGVALPSITDKDILETGAEFEVNRRIRDMYQTWANVAQTAADRAKNYAVEVARETEKRIEQSVSFAEGLQDRIRQTQRLAANQVEDRREEARSRQRQRDIRTRFEIERALLSQSFDIQNRMFSELQAGGVRVFSQKQRAYELEQQALFSIEERERKLLEVEQDRLDLKRQKRNVAEEIQDIDNIIGKVQEQIDRVKELNAIISSPSAPQEDRAGALVERDSLLRRIIPQYDLLSSKIEDLASLEPIGGQLAVDPGQITALGDQVTDLAKKIGAVTNEGAGKIQEILQVQANEYKNLASEAGSAADLAGKAFLDMASVTEGGFEAASKRLSSVLADSAAFADFVDSIREKTDQGLIDPEKAVPIDRKFLESIAKDINEAVLSASEGIVPIPLSADEQILADSVLSALRAARESTQKEEGARVSVGVSGESLEEMDKIISDTVKPTLDTTLDVKEIKGIKGTIEIEGQARARGGLMGTVMNALGSAQRLASGGPSGKVKGPGGPKDDRILTWLSNGEYVVDSLTTSRFGPKFFAFLQRAARGGWANSWLRKASSISGTMQQLAQEFPSAQKLGSVDILGSLNIPSLAMASGGPVGVPNISGFADIANDFTNRPVSRDVVDVRVDIGGRRATVQAEREQAKEFVDILKGLNRGR